jgi:hypothetical protein
VPLLGLRGRAPRLRLTRQYSLKRYFGERDVVTRGALGEMLPLNVATLASTALESPRDQAIRLAVANSNMMLSSDSLETVPAVRIHFPSQRVLISVAYPLNTPN